MRRSIERTVVYGVLMLAFFWLGSYVASQSTSVVPPTQNAYLSVTRSPVARTAEPVVAAEASASPRSVGAVVRDGTTVGAIATITAAAAQGLPTLSLADLTATLCSIATGEASGYVILYDLWGTPTLYYGPSATPTVTPTPGDGDVVRGKALFHGSATCSACHRINEDAWLVGPPLRGLSARLQERSLDPESYVRSVIRNPANVNPSVKPGIMPRTFSTTLTNQQIDDIVAYLFSLN